MGWCVITTKLSKSITSFESFLESDHRLPSEVLGVKHEEVALNLEIRHAAHAAYTKKTEDDIHEANHYKRLIDLKNQEEEDMSLRTTFFMRKAM